MQWSWKLGLGALLAVQTASAGFAASFSEVKLTASDAAEGDRLGSSIAVTGNTLVVSSVNVGEAAGAAYVFQRDARGGYDWIEVKKLTASDSAPGAHFGQSVAISGDTIVVGAESDAGMGDESGSAYIFERDWGGDDNWGQRKKLNASDQTNWDHFGWSVAIDGEHVVIGMYGDDDPFH